MQKQGEILLILVRRSSREGRDIASSLGIDPAYLSRLYKKSILPKSIIDKACLVFGISEDVFAQELPETLKEEAPPYGNYTPEEYERLTKELEEAKRETLELKARVYDLLREKGKL